jgi:hypothetical protein
VKRENKDESGKALHRKKRNWITYVLSQIHFVFSKEKDGIEFNI